MACTSDELLQFLAQNGFSARTTDHEPVFTVHEMIAILGDMPGAHTKNLFLRDGKKKAYLICLSDQTEVDLKRLRAVIGARGGLSFGSPDRLMEILGVSPGAVSPLAAINDVAGMVQVVIAKSLLSAEFVLCHPLVNNRTTSLRPDDLLNFLRLLQHDPMLIDESELADGERTSTSEGLDTTRS